MNINQILKELYNKPRFYTGHDSPENNIRDLHNLIKKYLNSETVMVEVGSFAGVSSELFALFVKHIYCIDPYLPYAEMDNRIHLAETEFDNLLLKYSNITKIKNTSEVASHNFINNSLDFIYIDGAHDYINVYRDIQLWIPKVKNGGFIGGHDYTNGNVRQAILDSHLDIIQTFEESSWIAQITI